MIPTGLPPGVGGCRLAVLPEQGCFWHSQVPLGPLIEDYNMSEDTKPRRKIGLPVAADEVVVETPKAESTTNVPSTEAARAERAKTMSVAGKRTKKADTPAKPAFVADADLITSLRGMTDSELIEKAVADGVLKDVDASDRRVFQWTGSMTDTKVGQPVTRSKIRHAIVDFLANRNAETDRLVQVGDKTYQHAAEGRVIHAYMFLGGRSIHGGSYDTGYVGARRGENKTRGMIARGFLRQVGDNAPTDKGDGGSDGVTAEAVTEI